MNANLYKTLGERIFALIIDALILWVIQYTAFSLFFMNFSSNMFWELFYPTLFMGYRTLMHSMYGQTIGKKVWHIKVVDFTTNSKIRFYQVILREIYIFLIVLIPNIYSHLKAEQFYHHNYNNLFIEVLETAGFLLFAVDIIVMFINKKKRALHDCIANTVVIDLGIIESIEFRGKLLK